MPLTDCSSTSTTSVPTRPGTQKNLSPRSATRCGSGKQAGGAFQRRLSFLQRVPQIPSQASQAQSAGKNAHAQSGPVPVSPVPGKGPHGAKHEQHRIKQKPPTFCNKQGTLYVGVRLNFSLVVKMATDIAMTQEVQCNLREQCIA